MTLRYLGIMVFGLLAIACMLGKSYDQESSMEESSMDDIRSIADVGKYSLSQAKMEP
jgi:hypothetical protein